MSEDRIVNRRRFFRAGLRELLKPLADTVENLAEAAKPFTELEQRGSRYSVPQYTPPLPDDRHWLRPPGALPEAQFKETCSRSGECIRACPAQAITVDYAGDLGGGYPYIDADLMSCVLCDSLACMAACPTGALVPTLREEIDIGTAVWHEDKCLRRHGDSCQICVDRCPIGAAALTINDAGQVQVIEEGCTGCGVCEHDCPTYPKSITVTPKSKRPEPENEVDPMVPPD